MLHAAVVFVCNNLISYSVIIKVQELKSQENFRGKSAQLGAATCYLILIILQEGDTIKFSTNQRSGKHLSVRQTSFVGFFKFRIWIFKEFMVVMD